MARPAIFSEPKIVRIQGVISKPGSVKFEQARKTLAKLVGWVPSRVSDADTIEFLARGRQETLKYLEMKKE